VAGHSEVPIFLAGALALRFARWSRIGRVPGQLEDGLYRHVVPERQDQASAESFDRVALRETPALEDRLLDPRARSNVPPVKPNADGDMVVSPEDGEPHLNRAVATRATGAPPDECSDHAPEIMPASECGKGHCDWKSTSPLRKCGAGLGLPHFRNASLLRREPAERFHAAAPRSALFPPRLWRHRGDGQRRGIGSTRRRDRGWRVPGRHDPVPPTGAAGPRACSVRCSPGRALRADGVGGRRGG
jgi:hypothetical protein